MRCVTLVAERAAMLRGAPHPPPCPERVTTRRGPACGARRVPPDAGCAGRGGTTPHAYRVEYGARRRGFKLPHWSHDSCDFYAEICKSLACSRRNWVTVHRSATSRFHAPWLPRRSQWRSRHEALVHRRRGRRFLDCVRLRQQHERCFGFVERGRRGFSRRSRASGQRRCGHERRGRAGERRHRRGLGRRRREQRR